jgi:Uma2 family endonuclease
MVNTTPRLSIAQLPPAEKRVSLFNVSWGAYEMILQALDETRAAQLTYDEGVLEIMTPLQEHESSSGSIDKFIHILTEEYNLTIRSLESTTLKRPDLKVGAEPNKGYYIVNEPLVRGKTVDLTVDPPPDLVLEVDITHPDINKNALYAKMAVPEFWRYNGKELKIYQLRSGTYQEVETSPTFPKAPKEALYQLISEGLRPTRRNPGETESPCLGSTAANPIIYSTVTDFAKFLG